MSGQPDFQVVGFGCAKSHVSGAEGDHTIMQVELAQNVFRMRTKKLEIFIGMVGMGDADQLHLVELVLAYQTFGILAVAAGLGAKAGREGRVCQGQLIFGQGFFPVQIGDRYLGSGNEVLFASHEFEEILFEFRQLSCARHGLARNDDRSHDFGIAMFARMDIEHESGECAFQFGGPVPEYGKARAAEFGGTFEVQTSESLAYFEMLLGFEIELGFFTPDGENRIVLFIRPDRHAFVRNIGKCQQPFIHFFGKFSCLLIKFFYFFRHSGKAFQNIGSVFSGAFAFCNFGRGFVAFAFECFHFGEQSATLSIEFAEHGQINGRPALSPGQPWTISGERCNNFKSSMVRLLFIIAESRS